MSKRRTYCFNCGEDLGVIDVFPGDITTCNAAECIREARNEEKAEREQRMLDAADDDFNRY